MSDRLSYSAPNALWVRVSRAMRPSIPSNHHRHEDRHRRLLEAAVHRLHDRVEAREQRHVVSRFGSQ
jgi:hypothetical protein